MTFNSRKIAYTIIFLLVLGFVAFFILGYDITLASHPTLFGKVVTAFFTVATTRTAGFNSVDMAALTFPSVIIMMMLMWIGASPGSTGGGIRTTTFAVAILNIINAAKNHEGIHLQTGDIKSIDQKGILRTMDVFITKLKKKLAADPSIQIINVRGYGYKLLVG